jgi:hypothetical protein
MCISLFTAQIIMSEFFLYGYMDKNNAIKHDSSNATLY